MTTENNTPNTPNTDHKDPTFLKGLNELGLAVAMAATNGARESSMVSTPICQDLVKDKIAFLEGLKEKPELVGGKPGQIAKNQIGEMVGLVKAFSRIGQALDGANSIYGAYDVHGQFKVRRSEMTDEQRADLPRLIANFGELVKFIEYATRANVEGSNVIWRRLKPSENSNNPRRDVAISMGRSSSSGGSRKTKAPSNPYFPGDTVVLNLEKLGEDLVSNLVDLGYDLDAPVTVAWSNGDSVGFEQEGVETETKTSRALRKEQQKRGQAESEPVMKLRVSTCKATQVSYTLATQVSGRA